MGLFSRKSLTPEEKDLVRELYNRSQKNPNLLSQEDVGIVNELYSRLDNEDPFRTALDQSSSGRVSNQEALEFVNKYGYEKPTRKLYKQIEGLGAEPEAPPVAAPVEAPVETPRRERPKSPEAMNTPSNMSVEKVLQEDKVKQDIQKEIDEAKERKRTQYTQIFGVDPNKDKVTAFRNWWNKTKQDPEKLDKYVQRYQTETDMYRAFEKSLEEGTLEKQFDIEVPKPKPELDKSLIQPTSMQAGTTATAQEGLRTEEPPAMGKDISERDVWQAASEFKLSEIIPFYSSSQEAIRLAKALKLIGQLKSGTPISNEDKTFLKELADDRKFEDSTIAAQAFDTLKEMIPFAGEIFATYGIFGIAKKGTQKLLSKKIKSEIKDYVEKGLLIDTSSKIVKGSVFVTETALLNKGFLTLSKMDDKISLEKQLPQFEFANNGLLITEQGMDKHTADKQATYDASREFLTEIVGGRFLKVAFPVLKKGFSKIASKLTPGQSEVVVAQATTNTIGDAIQRVTGVKLSKHHLIKARQLLQSFGYDGVLEEWGEERIGDATNEIVYALAKAKDANGESLLPGFDNEEYADNVVRDLAKGDFGKAWERTAVEVLAFSVPAGGAVTYAGTKSYLQEKTIKQKLPFLSKQITDAEEKLIEIEPEIQKLKEIEKPSPNDVIKLSDLLREKQKINTLQQLKQIIIDSPEIADEVDLSKIDLDKEITLTQKELEEQGVTLEGEGQEETQKISKVLGHTLLANSKLQLGLNEGATFDTVLEEYYGLIRRGGLTEEQRETYNEHYEKYKTDKNYRIKINEFINNMHEKMGLKKPISDTSQLLSSDKLFDKEGKSYEYKAGEQKQDIADKVYDYVGKMFNKVFGRTDKSDEMKDVYKKVQKRKLKISSKRAQRQEERESKKKVKAKPAPKSTDLPKNIKARKKEAKKVKEKKKIFNFIKNRTKKVQAKKIEKLSPAAIREVKAKIERAPEVNIPDDQREPLEILRAVLGDEQFTELTGIPSGPIANLDKIDPKIIPALTKKFPEYMSSLEKIDIIDLIPVEEQNKIINQVAKVVGKKTIEPIRLKKLKPKKIPTKKKDISYQLSVLDVSKKLANPKEVTEEDKVDVAVHEGLRETIKAIEDTDDGIIHESLQWYFTSVDQTMDLSSNEVDIEDALDEDVYKIIIAINSQKTRPVPNYNYAIDIFGHYQKNGEFNYKPTATTGKIRLHSKNEKGDVKIVGGLAGKVMTTQHKKLEFLFEKFGKEKAMSWLKTKHTGKEILDILEESGLTGYSAKKRPKHLPATVDNDMFYGAHLFGPKIGAFYANLSGRTDVTTYDLWWTRTWNRWMGTPISTTKDGKESIVDVPRNMEERALMDEAITRISDTLTEATGYKFTPPAVQAILWYYEKELYIKNDAVADLGVDFLRAAQNRAKEKGYATTPTSTKRDRRVTEQRIAKEKRDTASLKKGIKKTGKKARQKAPQVSYELDKPKKVKIKKDKKKGIGKPGVSYQLRDARDEYGISHRPSKEGPPAHDLFKGAMVPDDVYDTPRYYIGSHPNVNPKTYKETVDAIRYLKSIKGNPEAEVTVYRAGPKRELNNGDWITLSKSYAEGHADSWNTFEGENYKLHEFKVKAKDVLWDMNSLEEWGYFPKEKAPKAKPEVSYQLTPTQKEFFKDTKVVNPDGTPKVLYHGTPNSFDIFKETKDIGFHAGTSRHANRRIEKLSRFLGTPEVKNNVQQYVEGGNIMPVIYNIKNPMYLPDLNNWFPNDVSDAIEAEYGFEDAPKFAEIDTSIESKKEIVNYIKSKGFDGIIYRNELEDALDLTIEEQKKYDKMLDEGKLNTAKKEIEFLQELDKDVGFDDLNAGLSYIAFDANQIKSATAMADKPTTDPRISYQLEPTGLKTLYHVTPTKNLSTIKRVGLIPFQDTLWKDNEGNRLGDGSVFAFESLEDAQDWKRKIETDPGLPFDDATILKIDNKDDRWNEDVAELPSGKIVPMNIMGPDAGRWFKRNETVKPENISVVDEAKPSFQLAPTKPELFSPALRSIENLQANSLKRQGLRKHFKRNNVPKAELDWLGVMEWARENYKKHESIPKQELIDYIKANQSKLIVTKPREEGQVNEEAAMEAGWKQPLGATHWLNENESWMYDPEIGYTEIRKDNTPLYEIPFHAHTKHESLTMVGGENYKELLVRHPDGTFVEPSHWDIPGIIVSLRLTTRYDSKGNKILFIEEIQSDWTSRAYKLYKKEVLRVAKDLETSDLTEPGQIVPKGQEYKPKEKYIKQAEKKVPKDFGYITRKTQAEYDKEIKEAKAEDRKLRKELLNYVREQTSAFDKVSLVEIERTIKEAFDYANASIIDSVTNRLEDKNIEEFIVYFRSEDAKGKIPSWDLNKTQAKRIMKLWAQISTPSAIVEAGPPKGFEDTPYKHTADSMPWITLGVKNAILHAVNNNFDKIAVATPEQIEDMFDLSKKISSIRYVPIDPNAKRSDAGYKRFQVEIYDNDGNKVEGIPMYNTPEQLEDIVGKGIVDKMMAGDGKKFPGVGGGGGIELSGLDLRTQSVFHQTVYNATANALYKQGRRLDHKLKGGTTDIVITDRTAEGTIPADLKDQKVTRKSIDLTDTLKDKVNKSGIPSFQLVPVGEPLDIYDDISNKDLKKFGKGERRRNRFIKSYETALIPVSTLLKRINPKIYNMLLRYQFKVGTEQNKAKQFVVDMEKFVRKMPKKDQAIFKLAMLNSDGATILSLIEKYDNKQNDFLASYKKIRETLDILRDRLIENGEDVGYIEDYLPRKVLSHDKLIEYMYGNRNAKAVIEKQIEAKEKDLERPLTQSEKAELINQLIRGYSYLKSKPSYLKGRKFDKITADMIEFYEEPFIQLLNHMDRAIERIEQRTFLGFGENTDESIGEFVAGLMEQGINLTQEQQEDVFRIIKSYFDFKPTESYLSGIKTGAYGLLLGRFTNTITQVQDMVYSIYENGLGQHRTVENAVRYIFRLQRAKRKQLGIEAIGQEFKIDTKSKFNKLMDNSTNIILTGSGFKAMDGFGKSVLINSSIQKYKRKAQKNRLTKKDKAYLKSLFGKDYNDAIKRFKEKTSPSEYTDAELYIGYATILKYQPIGRTEVPLGYLENPNVGRMFYMLKTFAIKQLNVLRDDGLDIITGKQKGNKLKATRDMIYLTFLIVLAGAGGDELKDWIKQRKSTLEDKVIDNFLKLLLINKYFTDKIRRESAYKGAFKSILENGIDAVLSFPPITVAAELVDAMWVAIMKEEEDKKKSKGARYIFWIGDVLYYRRDVEQFIEKEIPALSGIGGRGRDDYVKRSLNAIYKMAKDRQLTEDELRIYKELIDDAKKYPQTKIVKGKSKRAIDVDKHRKMYKSESKKFKRVSPRDFIKKHPFISTELPTIKKALK